jgi:hypothetical protein
MCNKKGIFNICSMTSQRGTLINISTRPTLPSEKPSDNDDLKKSFGDLGVDLSLLKFVVPELLAINRQLL